MKDISTKVYKLLKQQPYTAQELSEITKSADVARIIDGLVSKGVPVEQNGDNYLIKDTMSFVGVHVFSQASDKPTTIRYAAMSDSHIGSIQHDKAGLEHCMSVAKDMGAQFVLHSGDLTDGYGVYPGQLMNLISWKVDDQTDLAANEFDKIRIPIYGIGGNHDQSFTHASGIRPSKLIEMKTPNYHDLGDFAADFILGGIEIRLLHGAGGNAYAQSYPAQKYLRNLAEGTPEQVPDILQIGHYHTNPVFEIYGCLVMHPSNFQGPNDFMIRRGLRGTRGLYFVELTIQNAEITSYTPKFIKAPQ